MREPPKRRVVRKVPERPPLKIEMVNPWKLKLWDKNPRDNEEAAKKLVKIIEQHGFIDPVIATRNGPVWAGNTRVKAARLAKLAAIPVIYIQFKSDMDAIAYSLADNKASENATWNENLLQELFGQLEEVKLLNTTGFSQLEMDKIQHRVAPAKSFAAAVEEFQRSQGGVGGVEQWVWIAVTGTEEEFKRLLKRYGVKAEGMTKRSKQRQLDWNKVRRRLLQEEKQT